MSRFLDRRDDWQRRGVHGEQRMAEARAALRAKLDTLPPKWLDHYVNVGPAHLTPEAGAECERWLDAHKHK